MELFSSDDRYVIVKNGKTFSVEDAQDGRILQTLTYDVDEDYSIDFWSKDSTLCISHGVYNVVYDIFSLPKLQKLYHGTNIHEYYNEEGFIFEYDENKHLLSFLNWKDSSVVKRININLDFLKNNYDYLSFELLDENTLYIGGLVGQMIVYDIRNNCILRKTQLSPDRYEGSFFNQKKTSLITYTMHGSINVYDAVYGESFFSFYPSENFWGESYNKISALHGYECSLSKDENYIVYMCENTNIDDGSWSVAVIKWDSLSEIIDKARKELLGRTLTNEEKKIFYIE